MTMTETAAASASVDGLIERIEAVRPLLQQNAARVDAERRVPDENIEALREAGAFKVMVPQRYGGYQATIRTKLEVSRAVAMGCGSTAWVTTLMNVCSMFTGVMNERAQDDVWGSDPDARVAGVFTPSSSARKVEGGWRVTGAWAWASGCMHADWLYVGVPLTDDDGQFMYPAMAIIPRSDVTIEDTWFTVGMRGTASNTIHADDVFVPEHRFHNVPGLLTHHYDTPFSDERLYRSAFVPVAALVLAGPQLGLAQAALDYVLQKGHTRGITYSEFEVQRDAPTFQLAVSKAATLVDTAHLFAYRAAADIDTAAADGREMSYVERARVRNDTGVAIDSAREAIRILCSAHGASSFAEVSPMQRWWRDSEVASRHAVVLPETSALIYGRALMGFTEGVSFLV